MKETVPAVRDTLLPVFSPLGFAGVCVLYLAAIHLAGGSSGGAIAFWLAFAVLVLCPGLALCGYLLPQGGLLARIPIAVAMGSSVLVGSFAAFGSLGLPFLCAAPGCLLTLLWLAGEITGVRRAGEGSLLFGRLAAETGTKPGKYRIPASGWLLLLLFTAALFLYIFSGVLPYAKPAAAGNMTYSQDMLWSVGNAAGVQFGFPLRDIRTAGGVMHYHYFADAVQGLLAMFSRQVMWDAVCYYCWPVWVGALFAGLYAVARRLGAGPMLALLPPFGVSFLSCLEGSAGAHFFVNANNVIQSYVFLTAAFLVLQTAIQQGKLQGKTLAAFLLVVTALVWTKAVLAALFLCGMAAAAAAWVCLHRRAWPGLWAMLGAGAAVFGILYGTIFSGAVVNLVFEPTAGAWKDVLRAAAGSYTPGAVLYLCSLGESLAHFKRMRFVDLLIHSMIPGGLLASVLFNHYSGSESYFYLAAFFLMWLGAVRTLAAMPKKRPAKAALACLCAVGMAATIYTQAPLFRYGAQTALRCMGLRPPFVAQDATITPGDAAAARWLRENTAQEDVFATNRNARERDQADGIFHAYTAMSQRQAYVEGWRYAMDYSMEYSCLVHNLEEVSDAIFACEEYEEAVRIARENGIRYLLLHVPSKGEEEVLRGGVPVFATETALVYAVGEE